MVGGRLTRITLRPSVERLEVRDYLSSIPVLHSLPGANHTIFLDFDGHTSRGTGWNSRHPVINAEFREDGSVVVYRGEGETRWSPIMGQGNVLSHWSNGACPNASNQQPDIGVLTTALGLRPDDYPAITPLPLAANGGFEIDGVVERASDRDTFKFDLNYPVLVRVEADPWHNGPNLDIGLSLIGADGAIVSREDGSVNPKDLLSSSFELRLPPGQYFLQLDGVGKPATAADLGYSDYGSLGYYRLAGFVEHSPPEQSNGIAIGDFDRSGCVDLDDFLLLANHYGTSNGQWIHGDANGDRSVDADDFRLLAESFGAVGGKAGSIQEEAKC